MRAHIEFGDLTSSRSGGDNDTVSIIKLQCFFVFDSLLSPTEMEPTMAIS